MLSGEERTATLRAVAANMETRARRARRRLAEAPPPVRLVASLLLGVIGTLAAAGALAAGLIAVVCGLAAASIDSGGAYVDLTAWSSIGEWLAVLLALAGGGLAVVLGLGMAWSWGLALDLVGKLGPGRQT